LTIIRLGDKLHADEEPNRKGGSRPMRIQDSTKCAATVLALLVTTAFLVTFTAEPPKPPQPYCGLMTAPPEQLATEPTEANVGDRVRVTRTGRNLFRGETGTIEQIDGDWLLVCWEQGHRSFVHHTWIAHPRDHFEVVPGSSLPGIFSVSFTFGGQANGSP
jgi:hypothetical protein